MMLENFPEFPDPPAPWEEIPSSWPSDQWDRQWDHYQPLFAQSGFTLRSLVTQQLPNPEPPSLPGPTDAFLPRPEELFASQMFGPGRPCGLMRRSHVRTGYDSLNRDVLFKVLFGSEREVVTYLSQLQSAGRDPGDHTIPFLKLIETPRCAFVITPRWGVISPPFYSLGEPIVFARQCLEGLAFLHGHRITHGDISTTNIVMSYHGKMTEHPEGVKPLRSLFDVKYAFIDYGNSRKFDGNIALEDIRVTGPSGTAPFVSPEMFKSAPYNPFRADVYALGVLVLEELAVAEDRKSQVLRLLKKHSPAFLAILRRMCKKDPRKRPTAADALEEVVKIHKELDEDVLRLAEQPELGDFDYEAWMDSTSLAQPVLVSENPEPRTEKSTSCLCQ